MPLNTSLRDAVTAAGGTPTQYNTVHLLRELVTAYGGTPAQFAIIPLLREAIVAKGGTPTQYSTVGLMRELVTALGGAPATWDVDALAGQVAEHSVPDAPGNLIANGTFDDDSVWVLTAEAAIVDGRLQVLLAGAGTAAQDTTAPVTENLFYLCEMTAADVLGGGLQASLGGSAGVARTADGAFSEYLRAGPTQEFMLSLSADAAVDNVALTGPITTPLNTELCPDPSFDDPSDWTLTGSNISITGGALVAAGGIGTRTATCAPHGFPLNAGTYETVITISARTAGSARVNVCGVNGTARSAVGTYTEQLVVTEADTATQSIATVCTVSPNLTAASISVKKIA